MTAKDVWAIVPARAGSVGLPRKNILPIAGKPLIEWTLLAARGSRYISRVVVSTDSAEISQIAKVNGAEIPFLRPLSLATSETPMSAVILHLLESLAVPDDDTIVLLQPTSPLRRSVDIDNALSIFFQSECDSLISVATVKTHPNWMKTITSTGLLNPLFPQPVATRRQDLPEVFAINGSIYITTAGVFRRHEDFQTPNTRAYIMPADRSFDIDALPEFLLCDALLRRELHDEARNSPQPNGDI